jgi:hypothetical protein
MKFTLLKKIISLIANKATAQEIYLEIGAYFIKKGANYKVGEILYKKKVQGAKSKLYKGKVVTNIWFEFDTNKIHVKRGNKFISPENIVKG